MLSAKYLGAVAARSGPRTVPRASARKISTDSGGPMKPLGSGPKLPGWQIAAIAGIGVAAFYAMFLATPEKVGKSSVPTNQTKNPSSSRRD
ncbi:hypothetical protein ISF_06063 [Cordyceps fumosorosea ARSEF 2679]|uniref:Uncharacterized protein n=1 Tax=Cordyceps fumosorosea (strain ARSEF 2679) TaxID=1081104 RepID=A0A167SY31_CORFA|nr:hypothetical protein ISF_06063 [Cordyceps fumosorosea ARSEF 2679]OAA60052.1 hypothetical protein ISF_06063 [Cordyceps fumosorosea ARSEF 2679]